jgi:hypothetical protein
MTNPEFLSHLSTSTLRSLYFGLRDDKTSLMAVKTLTEPDHPAEVLASIASIDEMMADIGIEVNGNRGETI